MNTPRIYISDNGNNHWKCENSVNDYTLYLRMTAYDSRDKAKEEYLYRCPELKDAQLIRTSKTIYEGIYGGNV